MVAMSKLTFFAVFTQTRFIERTTEFGFVALSSCFTIHIRGHRQDVSSKGGQALRVSLRNGATDHFRVDLRG